MPLTNQQLDEIEALAARAAAEPAATRPAAAANEDSDR